MESGRAGQRAMAVAAAARGRRWVSSDLVNVRGKVKAGFRWPPLIGPDLFVGLCGPPFAIGLLLSRVGLSSHLPRDVTAAQS